MTEKKLVEESQVERAVEAIFQLIELQGKSADNILDSAKKIELQFALNCAPLTRHRFRLDLPHSIDEDGREVCIFVKDLDIKDREYEKTVRHYETLFQEKDVTRISKIIPLKALRTDYCELHNKSTLCKAYDLFLCEESIKSFLPALLGKIFYNRKTTVPRQVNLEAKNLKQQIDKLIDNTLFEVSGHSPTCNVQIGNNKMSKDELIRNTVEALKTIAEKVPGGRNNIRTVGMKSPGCMSLPLYMNFVNPADIDMPESKKEELATYVDDVTTVENGLVSIRADGYIRIIESKPEISQADDEEEEEEEEIEAKLEIKDEDEGFDDGVMELNSSRKGKVKQKKAVKSVKDNNSSTKTVVQRKKGNKRKINDDIVESQDNIKIDKDTDVIEIKEEEDTGYKEPNRSQSKKQKRKTKDKTKTVVNDGGSSTKVTEIKEEIKEEVVDEPKSKKKRKLNKKRKLGAAN